MKKKHLEKTELEKRLEAEAAKEAEPATPLEADTVPQGSASEAAPAPAPEVDVPALVAERDALRDQLLRARAEFDNYRKRVLRDGEQMRKMAAESLIRDLLPAVDDLERALDHANDESGGLAQGVEMVLKQMHDVLARHGLARIPTVGGPFDPNVHEAITCIESDEVPRDHVGIEFQKGYRLGAYVLRPAKVAVSVGRAQPVDEDTINLEAAVPDTDAAVTEGTVDTPESEMEF